MTNKTTKLPKDTRTAKNYGKPYQGKYPIKNYQKYVGNPSNIVFRSSWELRAMIYMDNNPNIVEWSSEEKIVVYLSPKDNMMHRYFPDFWIKVRQEGNTYQECLIEVKPKAQTMPPKPRKRTTKRLLEETMTWKVNEAKWIAAEAYCAKNNMKFIILTEDDLL